MNDENGRRMLQALIMRGPVDAENMAFMLDLMDTLDVRSTQIPKEVSHA